MKLLNSLYARLAAAFLLMVFLLGGWLLYLSQSMSERYSQEVMQRLNQSVAMYVVDQEQLIDQGQVNESAIDTLAERAMILNPSLEIYVIDAFGTILSHRLPIETVLMESVSLDPVKHYLNASRPMPILGDDPRSPDKANSISVFPIKQNDKLQGYVYAIIGGQQYQQLRDSVIDSYTIRMGGLLMLGSIAVASFLGCILFFFLTRRLANLQGKVGDLDLSNPDQIVLLAGETMGQSSSQNTLNQGDEVDRLDFAFKRMARHIYQQFEALRSLDETRRELIANVSHDLRTPLASMQGYIETLMIKNNDLSEDERKQYLDIAYKHNQRLTNLVAELFELAKLEAGGTKAQVEPFSLLELAHDCVQEYGLISEHKKVSLDIESDGSDCFVVADIGLIHRVLQNLIDNAFKHTPDGGSVKITISKNDKNALVEVSDTGKGIQTHEIPYIFDRFYQSQQQKPSEYIGTGLGLAIVKRILDLHKTSIDVRSQIDQGTSFAFSLPQYAHS